MAARRAGSFVRLAQHRGTLPCVEVGNAAITVAITTGGGHIASVTNPQCTASGGLVNPLWQPPWPTAPPSLRRLQSLLPDFATDDAADNAEAELLSSILGHNLCLDVFGAHSEGEREYGGACFHGEAGQVEWEVTSVDADAGHVELRALLPNAQLMVTRSVSASPCGAPVVRVEERLTNLTGVDRALGVRASSS